MHRRHDMPRRYVRIAGSRRHWPYKLNRRRPLECSPDEFNSKVEDFFRHHISSARSTGNFNRACFRMALLQFTYHLQSPELACIYYSYILQECEEFISVDRRIVLSTLREYIRARLESHRFESTSSGLNYVPPVNPRMLRDHGVDVSSDSDSDAESYNDYRRIEVPYYERVITLCSLEQLLYKPFLYQDFECVKKLLQYTLPLAFGTDVPREYTLNVMYCIRRLDPILREAKFCDSLFDSYCRSHPVRRRKLLFMSLHFLVQKRREVKFNKNCLDSLKLFFEAIPDPMISSDEVQKFLLYIAKDLDHDTEILINDFCKCFQEEYPESALPLQPRKLKHLCRWQIRRCLNSAQQLPYGVKRLRIPNGIQKYILLEQNVEVSHQNTIGYSLKAS